MTPGTSESLARVRRSAIDECAIQKGHGYATVIVGADTKQVLWVARGRERSTLRGLFEVLGPPAARGSKPWPRT